jgi:hypothetical protein
MEYTVLTQFYKFRKTNVWTQNQAFFFRLRNAWLKQTTIITKTITYTAHPASFLSKPTMPPPWWLSIRKKGSPHLRTCHVHWSMSSQSSTFQQCHRKTRGLKLVNRNHKRRPSAHDHASDPHTTPLRFTASAHYQLPLPSTTDCCLTPLWPSRW